MHAGWTPASPVLLRSLSSPLVDQPGFDITKYNTTGSNSLSDPDFIEENQVAPEYILRVSPLPADQLCTPTYNRHGSMRRVTWSLRLTHSQLSSSKRPNYSVIIGRLDSPGGMPLCPVLLAAPGPCTTHDHGAACVFDYAARLRGSMHGHILLCQPTKGAHAKHQLPAPGGA